MNSSTNDKIIEKIYKFYCGELSNRSITYQKVEEYSVDQTLLDNSAKEIQMRLKVKLKNRGQASKIITNQLARHLSQLGENYNDKDGTSEHIKFYNPSEILDLIEQIELGKVGIEPFKYEPLLGLFKIHHSTYSGRGYSLIRNIKEYWFNSKGKLKRPNNFNRILEKLGPNNLTPILNQMHMEATIRKHSDGGLKGEWLILAKDENQINYFLCLANHQEGDEFIHNNKILPCYQEFPILRHLK